MKKSEIVKRIILLAIVLYVFLLSIKLMGSSFKLFGRPFAEQLFSLTSNPLVGLFIGILATSLVQSSSITTSVIVGLTASGALGAGSAVPIIMGANIGTSVTNTIVSLGHITKKEEFKKAFEVATIHDIFNFIIVLILFPLELAFGLLEHAASYLTNLLLGSGLGLEFSSPLDTIIKPVAKYIQISVLNNNAFVLLILSLIALFLSLRFFVKIMKPLAETEFKDLLHRHVFSSPARSFLLGLLFTILVQSSSVSTSLIVPLAGVGIVGLNRVFTYILGANIGTTCTALLASLVTGSPAAVTVALEHVLFNSLGSAIIYPIRKVPIIASKALARLSLKSKFYPLTYVVFVFYIVPSFVIFLFN